MKCHLFEADRLQGKTGPSWVAKGYARSNETRSGPVPDEFSPERGIAALPQF